MLAVVLDTNVLLARYANPGGAPAGIFDYIERQLIELVVSQPILDEYDDVLSRPKLRIDYGLTDQNRQIALATLGRIATFVTPKSRLSIVLDDPDDDKFIEAAISGSADFIVSGDKHLLILGEYDGIRIVTPAVFAAFIESQLNR